MVQFLAFRAEQTRNGAFMQALGDSADWLAKRLFIPSSLAVLVLGILLTIEGPWTFDTLWVDLGFAGFAASFLTGILAIKPTSEDGGTLLLFGAFAVAAIVLGAWSLRTAASDERPDPLPAG